MLVARGRGMVCEGGVASSCQCLGVQGLGLPGWVLVFQIWVQGSPIWNDLGSESRATLNP